MGAKNKKPSRMMTAHKRNLPHAEALRAKKTGEVNGFIKGGGVTYAVIGFVARKRMVTAALAAEALGITKGAAQVRLWRAAMAGRLVVKEVDGIKTYTVAKSKSRPHAGRGKKPATTSVPSADEPAEGDGEPTPRITSPADMGITPGVLQ
jgi:hypothetical protein